MYYSLRKLLSKLKLGIFLNSSKHSRISIVFVARVIMEFLFEIIRNSLDPVSENRTQFDLMSVDFSDCFVTFVLLRIT